MSERGYHHGDLRRALIDAGLQMLREDGEELSLRALARRVGVSATAVYRHFPDKDALWQALAGEAFAILAEDQRTASATAGGGVEGFGATGAAYVRFALRNPALFRLVFAHPYPGPHDDSPGQESAMAMLRASAEALTAPGVDPNVVALQAWSLAHGLAMLMLDGHVPADDAVIDAVVDARALGSRGYQ